MKKVFLVVITTPVIIVAIILIVSYIDSIPVDPVKRGIAECIQLYHDTRSDRLYDECFANMENFK